MESLTTVNIVHSHRHGVTFSAGLFHDGYFSDAVVNNHTVYTVSMRSMKNMVFNDLSTSEIHVAGCEFMSLHDASNAALWFQDSTHSTLCVMLGSTERKVILSFKLENWSDHLMHVLKEKVSNLSGESLKNLDAMARGMRVLRDIVFSSPIFSNCKLTLTNASFRVRPVRKLLERHNRDLGFEAKFDSALMGDYPTFLFDTRLASMIGLQGPCTTRYN